MARNSIIMMSDTQGQFSVTGDAVRADNYFGYTDGNHTVSVQFNNFTGRFYVEGTLSSAPTSADWFPIYLTTCNPYLEYISKTGTEAFFMRGNFVYLRARMDRSHMTPVNTSEELAVLGVVTQALLSH